MQRNFYGVDKILIKIPNVVVNFKKRTLWDKFKKRRPVMISANFTFRFEWGSTLELVSDPQELAGEITITIPAGMKVELVSDYFLRVTSQPTLEFEEFRVRAMADSTVTVDSVDTKQMYLITEGRSDTEIFGISNQLFVKAVNRSAVTLRGKCKGQFILTGGGKEYVNCENLDAPEPMGKEAL